jgi:hypothetical protein
MLFCALVGLFWYSFVVTTILRKIYK